MKKFLKITNNETGRTSIVDYLKNPNNWEAAFCWGCPKSGKEPPTYLQGYQKGSHFYVGRGFWEKETFPIARKELKND